MPLTMNAAARNGILDNGLDHWDGATIQFYDGVQPAAGGTPAGSLLASGTLPTPAFAASSGGAAAVASSWVASVSADGTITFMRLTIGGANLDIDVGEGSGGVNLDETTVTTGGTVTISGGTGITLPTA